MVIPKDVVKQERTNNMDIRLFKDQILVRRLMAEAETKSGVVLPGTAKEQLQSAVVITAGPGSAQVKAGDKVIFPDRAGATVKILDVDYILLSNSDILAILSEPPVQAPVEPEKKPDIEPMKGKKKGK